ncbi:hypothetical protein [Cryobacterium sp. GrIS_2_6]|uniref:hypothetical protein n=1 Tax=Cryobacterium sp. GrIS_2_6 TaxID=3162785 RepID=UPI002E017DEB|nr:O-antigen/teichoic acid export membrane protein [Cryobacterium psychrotolerans]
MRFFDWLWGNSHIGSLKFLFLTGVFGLIMLALVNGYVYNSAGGSRFLVIAVGVLPVLVIRWAYWSFRRKQLWRWVRAGRTQAIRPVLALAWNRPSLASEFQPVVAAYLQPVTSAARVPEDGETTARSES